MEIIIHVHHAVVSADLRRRAERAVHKLAGRIRRPVDAIVRFEQDGPIRRVEIMLHAPRCRRLFAKGHSRNYGPALNEAMARMESQLNHVKRTPKSRSAEVARV